MSGEGLGVLPAPGAVGNDWAPGEALGGDWLPRSERRRVFDGSVRAAAHADLYRPELGEDGAPVAVPRADLSGDERGYLARLLDGGAFGNVLATRPAETWTPEIREGGRPYFEDATRERPPATGGGFDGPPGLPNFSWLLWLAIALGVVAASDS